LKHQPSPPPTSSRKPSAPAADSLAKVTPARAAAFTILSHIAQNKGHSDELLHSHQIASLLARPGQQLEAAVAIVLRLGAFQLLHLDRIPAHAVLNESVELCRAAGHPHATGMVNAILRKLAAKHPASQTRHVERRTLPIYESPAAFAQRLAHPLWLVERWVAAYGRDAALAICEYGQRESRSGSLFPATPPIDNPADQPNLATPGPDAAPALGLTPFPMDDGSRLIAELAAAALPSVASRPRVWDACAAPGGKTLVLAQRLPKAVILATDISSRRLTETAARFHNHPCAANIRTAVADASTSAGAMPGTHFDLILCDVPCSGTGTIARNPEIRHRLKPADLARHAARQRAILLAAVQRLAPGGRIVYSTCSLEPEENEQVVESVINESGLRRLPIQPLFARLVGSGILSADAFPQLASAARDHALRTLPGIHPCDGFYASILVRD